MPITAEDLYNKYIEKLKQNKEKYKDNRDVILARNKNYFENNKNKVMERVLQKVKCPCCDVLVSRGNFHIHRKTDKHQRNLLNHAFDK